MEEARRVLDRLRRIDSLRDSGSSREVLLPELRALLREGQEWVVSERAGTEQAATALSALEERLHAAAQGSHRPRAREEGIQTETAIR